MREKGKEEKEGRREESKREQEPQRKGGRKERSQRVWWWRGREGGDGQTLHKKERFKAKKQVGENQKEGEESKKE